MIVLSASESLANKVHIACKLLSFSLLHLKAQVFWVGELRSVFIWRFKGCWQTLELILDGVKQNSGETEWLLTFIFGWEFWVASTQCKNHVCIGFAIVWLNQSFIKNDLDHTVQLLRLMQFDTGQGFHDGFQVVWANLVQQSTNSSGQFFHTTTRLCNSIGILSLSELVGWISSSRPSNFSVGCWTGVLPPLWHSLGRPFTSAQARYWSMHFTALQPPNPQH